MSESNSMLLQQTLAQLVKKAREDKNLTQLEFGKLFDPPMAQSTIARWEKGDLLPRRKHFSTIAVLLNLSLEGFIELAGDELIKAGIALSSFEDESYVPNKRHFNVLNRGVKSWNRWREKNYRIVPQLAGAKPKEDYWDEINFQEANLEGSNLSNKSLRGADLIGANLSNANFACADLGRADLSGANLSAVDLSGANLSVSK